MNIYSRYVSGEHDKEHFNNTRQSNGHIRLRPLSGQFGIGNEETESRSSEFWNSVLPKAAFFSGHDSALFGHVLTMLYKNDTTHKICAVSITKYGYNVYENIILDSSSRFWPACQNLAPEHRSSNVRKALAISNLKNFNKLWNNKGSLEINVPWDETNAGALASSMALSEKAPSEISRHLLSLDLLQESEISAMVVDVIYDNCFADPKVTEENNNLATLLGSQMEQLFDPLLEYSPQAMDYCYVPPTTLPGPKTAEPTEIDRVIEELFSVQSNYTMELVTLLQEFIIPLRIHVLTDVSNSTDGSVKVNTVFPPTVDEVARINCILNGTLKVAIQYGYSEVFQVLASIIPFFYKAFARHQANISCFHARFGKFLKHNRSYAFENTDINKHGYSPKMVENIIVGSLFELSKMKLIIQRLFDLVISELSVSANFENSEINPADEIRCSYKTITETIDSLGCGEHEDKTTSRRSRIFTPSGKLLTELATGWPEELQYGWMNRKVLAVHELKSVFANESGSDDMILIICSDTLLILGVTYSGSNETKVVLSDMLMNSLINQKPLPAIDNFPKLSVKYWCDVKQVIAKSYRSETSQNLTLMTYGDNQFSSKSNQSPCVSLSFSMKDVEHSESMCASVISQICKAQILHKSSPFHLFKSKDEGLQCFFSAHELQNYSDESSKSPLIILLNMDESSAAELLERHSQILIVLNLSYLNEHTVSVTGFSRFGILGVNEIVSTGDLSVSLTEVFSRCVNTLIHSSSLGTTLVEATESKIEHLLKVVASEMPEMVTSVTLGSASGAISSQTSGPVSPSTPTDQIANNHQTRHLPSQPQDQFSKDENSRNEMVKKTTIRRLLSKLRPGSAKPSKVTQAKKRSEASLAYIPQTSIPRGKKPAYKKLYKPDPSLREASITSSVVTEKNVSHIAESHEQVVATCDGTLQKPKEPRILSNGTMSSSRYSASIDAASNFNFPVVSGLDDIPEDIPGAFPKGSPEKRHSDLNTPNELDAKMSSVRYKPKKIDESLGKPSSNLHARKAPTEKLTDAERQALRMKSDTAKSSETEESGLSHNPQSTGDATTTKMASFEYPDLKHQVSPDPTQNSEKAKQNISAKSASPVKLMSPVKVTSAIKVTSPVKPTSSIKPMSPAKSKPELFSPVPVKQTEPGIRKEVLSVREVPTPESKDARSTPSSNDRGLGNRSTASVLENLNARHVNFRSYSRYKIYEELPLSILASAEDENWTALTRDSYSNLQTELQAMKLEMKDKGPSLLGTVENTMVMKPQFRQPHNHEDTFSTFEFVSYLHEDQHRSSLIEQEKSIYDLKHSLQSSTSDFVNVFENQLDVDFSLRNAELDCSLLNFDSPGNDQDTQNVRDVNHPRGIPENERQVSSPAQASQSHISIVNNIQSSDDEYFSSHEFTNALDFWNKEDEHGQETYLLTSSSSEKTLMNDFVSPPKIKEIKDGDPKPHTTKWESNVRSIDLADNYGSLAYLSGYLTGEVEI